MLVLPPILFSLKIIKFFPSFHAWINEIISSPILNKMVLILLILHLVINTSIAIKASPKVLSSCYVGHPPSTASSHCGPKTPTYCTAPNRTVIPTTPVIIPPIDISTCPKACDVHWNTCHAETAPNCIFPDPSAKYPRAACACRAGYKSSAYPDTDTTKQWRLPVVGQEYRVWVAEGVMCDKLCTVSYGVNSCQEVKLVDKACIG